MSLESPVFLTKVECPICGTVNEYETIRVGAYTEGERGTDFCPTFIKWRNPKYQKYHPLLFFTATCTNCFYTREFNSKFKEWAKDNNFRAYRQKSVREKHLECLSANDSLVKQIGGVLDKDRYPDETAILKLLLAIHDEQLNEHPSNLDLGRFYLRIAWIYRYCGEVTAETPGKAAPTDHLNDIDQGIIDLRAWVAGLGRNIGYLREAVAAHFDRPDAFGTVSPDRAQYEESLSQLDAMAGEGQSTVAQLEAALAQSRASSGDGALGGSFSHKAFHTHASFDDFVSRLLRLWDGVPRNEMDAMRLAVRYYISAFENGKEIEHGNPSVQAAYLIAELSRKFGDHDTARRYFNTTIKTGQEFINEIRGDRTRTALARKLLELAMAQGKRNLAEAR